MVGGFISGILGKVAKGVSTGGEDVSMKDTFTTAFWVLEECQRGLGARALSYTLSGDDRPVLLEIEAQRKIPRQQPDYGDRAYHERVQKARAALRVLIGSMGGQSERLARLAEILHAFQGPVNLRHTFSGKTVFKAPETVAQLLMVLGQQYGNQRDKIETEARTEAEDVLAAVKILGGRASDILVFDLGKRYFNRLMLADGRPIGDVMLTDMATDEIVHALRAMDAVTRTSALKAFARHERSQDPELLDYLMGELGVTSAKVREQARLILMKYPAESIESRVIEALSAGKTSVRAEAAILAGEIGNEACKAALRERLTLEKSAATLAIVEQYIGLGKTAKSEETVLEGSYLAAGGDLVTVPEFVALPEDSTPALGAEDYKALVQAREAVNKEAQARYKGRLSDAISRGIDTSRYCKPVPIGKGGDNIFDWISTGIDKHGTLSRERAGDWHIFKGYIGSWLAPRLDKLPLKRQVQIASYSSPGLQSILYDYRSPVIEKVMERLEAGEFDLRHVIDEASAMKLQIQASYNNPESKPLSSLSLIEMLVERGERVALPDAVVWPMLAEHIPVLVDALPPKTSSVERNRRALRLLGQFPSLPASAVQSVIFCAISERPGLRDRAQALLLGIEGVDTRLIAVLDDKRQAVRGNAARFLADRGCVEAVKPIEKRLKKEKAENARAEMISALARLGADVSPYLGRKALLAEAEKLAAKLPGTKLEWLPWTQIPALRWKDGKVLPDTVIDAWLKLALKLKQPGGSPLFGLYLEQLQPDDVTALADWLLASWIAYDTARGDVAELREQARKRAESIKASNSHSYYQNQTIDQLTEMYLRPMLTNYSNSGSDSKGILALTHRATPATMVQRTQSYLKNHGKRVSQAKTLIEVLAAAGTPEALQVLVATATRFKQRTVRELAAQLVSEIATERGWSEDELADRSVPSGGFEEDGTLELEVGETGKCYTARFGEDLSVKIFNPDGKAVKGLPAGKDETTKESKALLSTAKKTVKTVTAQQAERLFGAMVAERRWTIEDWRSDILGHPIVRRLTERVIWLGFNDANEIVASFRPTPEGDFLSADGDDVDLGAVTCVGVAHTSHIDEETRQAWLSHRDDFEVTALFGQIERPMQILSEAQRTETALVDRKGWLMESLKLRSVTGKAGFERGPVEDGGGFSTYIKPFRSAGITTVLNFSGSYVPEENIPAAIIELSFVKGDGAYGKQIKLGEVPAILLSECWADLHQIAEGGSFDPEWQKKGLY